MNERRFASLFGKFLKNNPPEFSTAYEYKVCKKTSFPFRKVKKHQERFLLRAKIRGGVYKKISDFSPGVKQFDAFYLRGAQALLVILFYVPYKEKMSFAIDIQDWLEHSKMADRKSLTREAAEKICKYKVDFKGGNPTRQYNKINK